MLCNVKFRYLLSTTESLDKEISILVHCIQFQFVPHREHSVLPVERPLAEQCTGKYVFVLRILDRRKFTLWIK